MTGNIWQSTDFWKYFHKLKRKSKPPSLTLLNIMKADLLSLESVPLIVAVTGGQWKIFEVTPIKQDLGISQGVFAKFPTSTPGGLYWSPSGGGVCSSYYSFVVIYFHSHSHVKVAMHAMAISWTQKREKQSLLLHWRSCGAVSLFNDRVSWGMHWLAMSSMFWLDVEPEISLSRLLLRIIALTRKLSYTGPKVFR